MWQKIENYFYLFFNIANIRKNKWLIEFSFEYVLKLLILKHVLWRVQIL